MPAPTNHSGTVLTRSLPLGLAALLGCSGLDAGTDRNTDAVEYPEPDLIDWSCLDQEPLAALPPPEHQLEFNLTVPGNALVSTISVTLCALPDVECAEPLQLPCGPLRADPAPITWSSRGTACGFVVPLPAGFSGFLELELEQPPETPAERGYLPLLYSLGGATGSAPSLTPILLLFQRQMLDSLVEHSMLAEPVEAGSRGAALLAVSDCSGNPVGDARLEIHNVAEASPGALPFLLPASRIPLMLPPEQVLHTSASGLAGYLLLPPGPLQVLAFIAGRSQPVAAVELTSAPGRLSMAELRPTQASVPGAP